MRIFLSGLIAVFALASSAFAGNVALTSLGANATCGGTGAQSCILTTYVPNNAIDGNAITQWVAPGGIGTGAYVPYLLIDLGANYTVDFINVSSWNHLTFVLYAGTSSNAATLMAGTPLNGSGGTT